MIISFLASHGGSSAKALITAMRQGQLPASPGILISNNRDAPILHWCLDNAVDARHISSKTHRGVDNADEAICSVLQNVNTDLVICSGYMKLVGPLTVAAFEGRIMNIHPALLPKYGGKGMYGDNVHRAVLEHDETVSGATVHIVTTGIDDGPVILQQQVPVLPDDDVARLRARVQSIEPQLYLAAVQQWLAQH